MLEGVTPNSFPAAFNIRRMNNKFSRILQIFSTDVTLLRCLMSDEQVFKIESA